MLLVSTENILNNKKTTLISNLFDEHRFLTDCKEKSNFSIVSFPNNVPLLSIIATSN